MVMVGFSFKVIAFGSELLPVPVLFVYDSLVCTSHCSFSSSSQPRRLGHLSPDGERVPTRRTSRFPSRAISRLKIRARVYRRRFQALAHSRDECGASRSGFCYEQASHACTCIGS
jgi:hypothetical protein